MEDINKHLDDIQDLLCEEMKTQLSVNRGKVSPQALKEIREFLKQNGVQAGVKKPSLEELNNSLPFEDNPDSNIAPSKIPKIVNG